MALSAMQKCIMDRFRHEKAMTGLKLQTEFGPGALDAADRLVARQWLTVERRHRLRIESVYRVHPSVWYPT